MDAFYPIITKISKNDKFQSHYGKELVFYYGLVIGLYRFLEGVSWGYSTLLTHKELDSDNLLNVKVLYNFMVRLKRFFLVKRESDFSDCQPSTLSNVNDYVNNEIDFLSSVDHDDMENLVKGNVEPTKDFQEYSKYLRMLDDPSILTEEKEIIKEFCSHVVMDEISVKSIEELYKKRRRPTKIEPITIMTEESKDEESETANHEFPTLGSLQNILGVRCSERVSKLITQQLSHYSDEDKITKNVVSIIHYCLPQNKLTSDCYYIVKNIIYSILNK
jgi:hypothetical protein